MRVVFFGTSGFALPALQQLDASDHAVLLVVTQPARPAGRGRRLRPSPVQRLAERLKIEVAFPDRPNDPAFAERLRDLDADIGVLVAYGHILRPTLLTVFRLGFINLHPSLLPRYRGAAPVQRALLNGETETGISVIRMDARVDAGAVLVQQAVPIDPLETAGELESRLSILGGDLLLNTVGRLEDGHIAGESQDDRTATKAPKITAWERTIDWSRHALAVHNHIRALSPDPGACTTFRTRRLIVLRAAPTETAGDAPAGTVLTTPSGLTVAAGQGAVELLTVKPEAGREQTGHDFRNGQRVAVGEKIG